MTYSFISNGQFLQIMAQQEKPKFLSYKGFEAKYLPIFKCRGLNLCFKVAMVSPQVYKCLHIIFLTANERIKKP